MGVRECPEGVGQRRDSCLAGSQAIVSPASSTDQPRSNPLIRRMNVPLILDLAIVGCLVIGVTEAFIAVRVLAFGG